MSTRTTSQEEDRPFEAEPQQLELLPPPGLPVRYQLSKRTRRIGLVGVAHAKAVLAEQAARRHEQADEAAHLAPPQAA
jgi:hypothetical protein